MAQRSTVHPEERLSLAKTRLEGSRGWRWFETGLRQAQSLLTTNG